MGISWEGGDSEQQNYKKKVLLACFFWASKWVCLQVALSQNPTSSFFIISWTFFPCPHPLTLVDPPREGEKATKKKGRQKEKERRAKKQSSLERKVNLCLLPPLALKSTIFLFLWESHVTKFAMDVILVFHNITVIKNVEYKYNKFAVSFLKYRQIYLSQGKTFIPLSLSHPDFLFPSVWPHPHLSPPPRWKYNFLPFPFHLQDRQRRTGGGGRNLVMTSRKG